MRFLRRTYIPRVLRPLHLHREIRPLEMSSGESGLIASPRLLGRGKIVEEGKELLVGRRESRRKCGSRTEFRKPSRSSVYIFLLPVHEVTATRAVRMEVHDARRKGESLCIDNVRAHDRAFTYALEETFFDFDGTLFYHPVLKDNTAVCNLHLTPHKIPAVKREKQSFMQEHPLSR